MLNTLSYLKTIDFPALQRDRVTTLQLNLGYRCNLSCHHCHVNAGPNRTESMSQEIMELALAYAQHEQIQTLDLTGGAPEMNACFRWLVSQAHARKLRIIDRCNLTILAESGYEELAEFLAENHVEVIASLPCYLEQNVDIQRGRGVYQTAIQTLRRLNDLGYGHPHSGLTLKLVYNPLGPTLPPEQTQLESAYRNFLGEHFGIVFNQLLTLANMPIQRFGAMLLSKNQFDEYLCLLRDNYRVENLENVMCRTLISVDWQGCVYDCDFNQMLEIPLGHPASPLHLQDLLKQRLQGCAIAVAGHCYGCAAGQGSSCGGALR